MARVRWLDWVLRREDVYMTGGLVVLTVDRRASAGLLCHLGGQNCMFRFVLYTCFTGTEKNSLR